MTVESKWERILAIFLLFQCLLAIEIFTRPNNEKEIGKNYQFLLLQCGLQLCIIEREAHAMCLSISFNQKMLMCELNSQKESASLSLVNDCDYIYREIPDIVDYRDKKCGNSSCNHFSKCFRTKLDKYVCIEVEVNGGWSEWNPCGGFSVTCRGGTRSGTRTCDNPTPRLGGQLCNGQSSDSTSCNTHNCSGCTFPFDCFDIHNTGQNNTGLYYICPGNISRESVPIQVLCNMEAYGGGWTREGIQHRNRGCTEVNFNTTWNEYKRGFGNVGGNYWLGNDAIHRLTSKYNNSLYIRLRNTQHVSFEVQYSDFYISDENDGYRLSLGEKTGTIGILLFLHDAFRSYSIISYPFYTFDHDTRERCADMNKSGWWYHYCTVVNLNAPFSQNHRDPVWYGSITYGSELFLSEMLIRRKS